MAKEVVIQVRIEKELREEAEKLYKDLGTSLSEAIRIFISQSIKEKGFPFTPTNYNVPKLKAKGLLHEYANPKLRKIEDKAFEMAMEEKYGTK